MLRLRDARTGELTQVLPAGRRQLRVLVCGAGQVRAYLTADLLRRTAERSGLLPLVSDLVPAGYDSGPLRATADALNIHPPVETLASSSLPDGTGPFDVGVRAAGQRDVPEALARLWIEVRGLPGEGPPGDEPLATRLRLMRTAHGAAPEADADAGADEQELARWRLQVARWAQSPSGAISRPHDSALMAALGNDLDAATALRELAALAGDPGVSDGVKFETFAAADRLLGLDLARDIGR
ncbi:MAG TPA: hypothetical protein VH478_00475 [Trebonia sp.]|nr:hypothetical protein [Trebonia sp.]